MSPLTLVIEVVLAIMLAACLYYFWRLDKRLAELRSGQDGALRAAADLARLAPAAANAATVTAALAAARAPATAPTAARRVDIVPAAALTPANDAAGAASTIRETRITATAAGGAQAALLNPATSRTRGIGNRFRAAAKPQASAPAAAAAPKPSETYS